MAPRIVLSVRASFLLLFLPKLEPFFYSGGSEDAEAVGIRFWAVFSSSSVAVFGGGGGAAFIFSKIFDLDRSFYDLILDELRFATRRF